MQIREFGTFSSRMEDFCFWNLDLSINYILDIVWIHVSDVTPGKRASPRSRQRPRPTVDTLQRPPAHVVVEGVNTDRARPLVSKENDHSAAIIGNRQAFAFWSLNLNLQCIILMHFKSHILFTLYICVEFNNYKHEILIYCVLVQSSHFILEKMNNFQKIFPIYPNATTAVSCKIFKWPNLFGNCFNCFPSGGITYIYD